MDIPKPPTLDDYKYGTKLKAGLGVSTVIADFDFETYSPAGYVWNEKTNKFECLDGSNIKGLPAVGAAVYSEHPEAEVLCLAYDLKDGLGVRQWAPTNSLPVDLFEHLAQGKLLEAWNVTFERWIWENICVPKYAFPPLPVNQLRCAASKSRAFALPGSLDPAGKVVNIKNKKLEDGKRLITKFCCPRNPTKSNPDRRIFTSYGDENDEDIDRFLEYNRVDIKAEAELSSLIPDLNNFELRFWQADQEINHRGVQIDVNSVNAAIEILEQAEVKYNKRIQELTNGAVNSFTELKKITDWMKKLGLVTTGLTSEDVDTLLKKDLPSNVRSVLEIRKLMGSAAVRKLYAMRNTVTRKGRVHDLFLYHSARTGRAAGVGVQPQNLPNSGPGVSLCVRCYRHYSHSLESCPWCGGLARNLVEWGSRPADHVFDLIQGKSLGILEYHFENPIAALSGCLRGMFISAPGKDLICSDYSAIEAVVLAALAGEEWRMEVFRTHGKIYEMSASKITGVPFSEFEKHKAETGQHHPLRKTVGKVAELACFSPDTQVLTNRGFVSIVGVRTSDLLWDGIEWIKHQGVVSKGEREIINLDGVRMTPTHPINIGNSWKEAGELNSNQSMFLQALDTASENLPSQIVWWDLTAELENFGFNALAELLSIESTLVMHGAEKQLDVISALRSNLLKLKHDILKTIGDMNILFRLTNTEDVWETDYPQQLHAALMSIIECIKTMEAAVSQYMNFGEEIKGNSLNTLRLLKDGITNFSKWIESTLIKDINPEIFNSSLVEITKEIKERLPICKIESSNSSLVYDIAHAGPRNRFTIKTNSGHLIVHNSGYQGWIGAWSQFGADKFMTEEEIKTSVLAWRRESPKIVEFWGGQQRNWQTQYYGLEGTAILAIQNPGQEFEYRGLVFLVSQGTLYIQLLSGRYLTYHRVHLVNSEKRAGTYTIRFEGMNTNVKYGSPGWTLLETYGGKLTENVVQATARDILANAIVNLEDAGYPVVLHVHDEIVSEVPEGFGNVEEFERIMSTMPAWAKDWPLRAKGGWRGKRYSK